MSLPDIDRFNSLTGGLPAIDFMFIVLTIAEVPNTLENETSGRARTCSSRDKSALESYLGLSQFLQFIAVGATSLHALPCIGFTTAYVALSGLIQTRL
jgi:hypothetical protein